MSATDYAPRHNVVRQLQSPESFIQRKLRKKYMIFSQSVAY